MSDLYENSPKYLIICIKFGYSCINCLKFCTSVLITLQTTNSNLLEHIWPYKQRYCLWHFWKMCFMAQENPRRQFMCLKHFCTAYVVWHHAGSHKNSSQPQNNVILAILSLKKIFFYVLHAVKFSMCFLCTILNAFLHTKNCWKRVTHLFSLIVCFL